MELSCCVLSFFLRVTSWNWIWKKKSGLHSSSFWFIMYPNWSTYNKTFWGGKVRLTTFIWTGKAAIAYNMNRGNFIYSNLQYLVFSGFVFHQMRVWKIVLKIIWGCLFIGYQSYLEVMFLAQRFLHKKYFIKVESEM